MTPISDHKPFIKEKKSDKSDKLDDFQYARKLTSAVYAFLLFFILSQKASYKVLDIIAKVFTNNLLIIDENENPQFMGTLIMSFITAIIIFIF